MDEGAGNGTPRRVVITGLGAVTAIGSGKEGLWAGVVAAKSAVRRITKFDVTGYRSQLAAEVPEFDAAGLIGGLRAKRVDRYSQFALVAAQQAWEDARLSCAQVAPERIGVSVGSALGGIAMAESESRVFLERGLRRINPSLALCVFTGAASCNIAIEFGLTGPATSNGNSCASGTIAIGDGLRMIQRGEADAVLAVGAEAPLAPLCYGAFSIIRAMSARNDDPEHASRPFDRERDGFVMGEGAAALVLELREQALSRGATIYGEVLGYGLTNDGYHMTAPRPDAASAARAMATALREAGVTPPEVDHINAHGSSTPLNDCAETAAIKAVFGEHAYRIPISGTKSLHGHPLGAAGAIEAAISVLALERGFLPPTANLEHRDPECDLDYVGPSGRQQHIDCVLSNSFGFGGINASIVIRRDGRAA